MIRILAIAALLTLAASPGEAGIRQNGVEPNGINRNGAEAGEAAMAPALRGLILRDGRVILNAPR